MCSAQNSYIGCVLKLCAQCPEILSVQCLPWNFVCALKVWMCGAPKFCMCRVRKFCVQCYMWAMPYAQCLEMIDVQLQKWCCYCLMILLTCCSRCHHISIVSWQSSSLSSVLSSVDHHHCLCFILPWWPSGVDVGLKSRRSRVWISLAHGFFRVESYQWLKKWHSSATLPGAWYYRVSAGTGRPHVGILWLGEMESLICNFYLSVAACKIVWTDLSQRYTSMLLGH